MKKTLYLVVIALGVIGMASCSIDDSNDIEVIKPGDTVIVGAKRYVEPHRP